MQFLFMNMELLTNMQSLVLNMKLFHEHAVPFFMSMELFDSQFLNESFGNSMKVFDKTSSLVILKA